MKKITIFLLFVSMLGKTLLAQQHVNLENIWEITDRNDMKIRVEVKELADMSIYWSTRSNIPLKFRCKYGQINVDINGFEIEFINILSSSTEGERYDKKYWKSICKVNLANGEIWDIIVNTYDHYTFLTGESQLGDVKIQFQDLKNIKVLHNANNQCPICNKVYYYENWFYCPFEGAKLKKLTNK